MGRLTNLNPPAPIADADIPASIARDSETAAAINAHLAAADPHLQYPTQARGDARYARKYGQSFKVAPSASQTIPSSVHTKINFDTIIFNTGNQFANSRLTAIDTQEIWRITTYILFELPASTTARVMLRLYKNGVAVERLHDISFSGNNYWGVAITPSDIVLNSGNFLELFGIIYATNGKIYGDNTFEACWWEGSRVG